MVILSPGARASRNGRDAEAMVASVLDRRGVAYQQQKILARSSIYGSRLKTDFYCSGIAAFPDGLCIEVKWQESSGSVYEKFPYLLMNIRNRYPCPVIVVADGKKMHPGGIAWLKKRIDGDHLYAVFTFMEFMTWANRSL